MYKNKKILAIIPARGGSKKLPGKNIKILVDKPLIAHSILFSKGMKEIDRTVVSTDDKKIAEIAKKYGAEVIMRPAELARDDSPTIDALKHVIDKLDEDYYAVVLLQPTSPIRKQETIRKMLELYYADKEHNTVITAIKFENPRIGRYENGEYTPVNYRVGQRRQDIEPVYQENSNAYVISPANIKQGKLFDKKLKCVVISEQEGLDIDTLLDFKFIEVVLGMKDDVQKEK